MSAFEKYKEELDKFEQMFGRERGRLAVSLDRLTNALVLVGQHHQSRAGARQGIGAIGDGRNATSKRKEGKSTI